RPGISTVTKASIFEDHAQARQVDAAEAVVIVLDTDHLSLLEWESPEARRLAARLAGLPSTEVATTIINFEEQMRGWLSVLARARMLVQQIAAYRRLLQHMENYRDIRILPFDERAATELQRLMKM